MINLGKIIYRIDLKLRITIMFISFIFIYVLGSVTNYFQEGRSICLFNNLTGLECPGCGLTRSILYLTHGELNNSINLNLMGLPLMTLGIIYLLNPLLVSRTLSYLDKKLGGQATKSQFIQYSISISFVLLINSLRWQ